MEETLDSPPQSAPQTALAAAPASRLLDLIVAQNKALELALHNEPLSAVLDVLALAAESHIGNGCLAAILLLDPSGSCLRHGAAPSLAPDYCRAIDGVAVGPNVGSCGASASRKEIVVTPDIANDPNWLPFRDLALAHGLRAAWSKPIFSSSGDVLGTFGLYYREVKNPEPDAQEIVELLIKTAAIVIERDSLHGRTARRLDEQRERLIHTFSRIAAVVGIVRGPDHRYEFVNDEFRRVVGNRDYVGRALRDVIPEIESQEILAILDQVYRSGVPIEGKEQQVALHDDDGRLRTGYYNFRFDPFFDQFGAVEGVVQTAVEVTEQVLSRQTVEAAKSALLVEKENLRSLFEEAPSFFCVIAGPDLRFEYVNPAHRAIFGGQDFTGRTVREAQPELEGSGFTALLEGVLQTGKPAIVHESPAMIGTEERFFDLIYAPRRNARGEVDGILALGMDITDRVRVHKQVEGLLEDLRVTSLSDRRFKTSFTHATVGKVVLDVQGRLLEANKAFCELVGYESEEIPSLTIHSVTHPEDYPECEALVQRMLRGEVPAFDIEKRCVRKDGSTVWLKNSVSLVRDEDGRPQNMIALCQDVTKRIETTRELEDAVRSRDEFLSIASHELKTPLTALNLQAQMARRTLERSPDGQLPPDKIERLVLHAENSVKRLMRLVDDMLDIARLSTGRLTLKPERFELGALTREVIERFTPEAQSAETRLTLSVCDEAWGNWDLFRVEQVVSNFLSNALRYGGNSPIDVRVEKQTSGFVRLSVSDRGPGIAPENHERIFRRFERGESAQFPSGLGLGLSICREIVGQHGGTVGVDSALGRGATFYAEFPLA